MVAEYSVARFANERGLCVFSKTLNGLCSLEVVQS